jgi:hypothetical protein
MTLKLMSYMLACTVYCCKQQCLWRERVHTSAEPSNSSAYMEVCAASCTAAYYGADSYYILHGVW